MNLEPIQQAEAFEQIVQRRRSLRGFSAEADFEPDAVRRSLERAVLSPNSSNLQLWAFHRIKSEAALKELAGYCFGQPAASTAREMVVFVVRRDLWSKRAAFMYDTLKAGFPDPESEVAKGTLNYYGKMIPQLYTHGLFGLRDLMKKLFVTWKGRASNVMYREVGNTDTRIVAHKSTALAAQTFMLSMTAEGYDSCPMEGFDSKKVMSMLNLPKGAEISMIVGVGSGIPSGLYGPRIRVPNEEVIHEH